MIAGYAGSGKSTAAELLAKHYKDAHISAFAAAVKDQVSEIYNIPRYLLETQEGKRLSYMAHGIKKTGRQLLIEHSAFMKTIKGNDVWAEIVVKNILSANPDICIIHDWRYKNEYSVLKTNLPKAEILTIRIVRDGVVPLKDPSEHDLDDFDFDCIIKNNTSKDDLDIVMKTLVI